MFAEENGLKGDPRLQAISEAIRVVPHFPKQGFLLFIIMLFSASSVSIFFFLNVPFAWTCSVFYLLLAISFRTFIEQIWNYVLYLWALAVSLE